MDDTKSDVQTQTNELIGAGYTGPLTAGGLTITDETYELKNAFDTISAELDEMSEGQDPAELDIIDRVRERLMSIKAFTLDSRAVIEAS